LVTAPILLAEVGRNFGFRIYYGVEAEVDSYAIEAGSLPPGIMLDGGRSLGEPAQPGLFEFRIEARSGKEVRRTD
jgi:hypothetical protein